MGRRSKQKEGTYPLDLYPGYRTAETLKTLPVIKD